MAKGFWLDVDCGSFNTSFFSLDVNSWLHTNATSEALMPSLGASWGIFLLFGTWKLWFQKKKKKFQQQDPSHQFCREVDMLATEFTHCGLCSN